MVNNIHRCTFNRDSQEISASGFNVTKDNEQISVQIRAIPLNDDWPTIESKPCVCHIQGRKKVYNINIAF